MSESTIRTEIYNTVSGVTNIGKVYDYERWTTDWTTFLSLFKTTIGGVDQIRGWEIGRRAVPEKGNDAEATMGQSDRIHEFLMRGYMAVSDAAATEKTFNTLIESICDAFRSNFTLNGTALHHEFVQGEIIEFRTFGGVLCHYAELSIRVHEQKNL